MRGLPREPIPLERLDEHDLIGIALGEPHPTAPVQRDGFSSIFNRGFDD